MKKLCRAKETIASENKAMKIPAYNFLLFFIRILLLGASSGILFIFISNFAPKTYADSGCVTQFLEFANEDEKYVQTVRLDETVMIYAGPGPSSTDLQTYHLYAIRSSDQRIVYSTTAQETASNTAYGVDFVIDVKADLIQPGEYTFRAYIFVPGGEQLCPTSIIDDNSLHLTVLSTGEDACHVSFADDTSTKIVNSGEQFGVKINFTVDGDRYYAYAFPEGGGAIVSQNDGMAIGTSITLNLAIGPAGKYTIKASHRYAPDRPPRDCTGQLSLTVKEPPTPSPSPIPIPGEIQTGLGTIPTEPGRLAGGILLWGTGIVGGIAFLMMLYGGFLILTSGGHPENLALGREVFTAAVVGLLFVLFAVWLMRFLGGALPIPGIG